jgi:hypothetical protein
LSLLLDSGFLLTQAGGAGVEYYFGYSFPNSDLSCQDFRSRANMWTQSRLALEFFANYSVPFWTMKSNNAIRVPSGSSDRVLESANGETLVLQRRGTTNATRIHMVGLPNSTTYTVEWFDPRDGGPLQAGSISIISGGGFNVSYGIPPGNTTKDWILFMRKV